MPDPFLGYAGELVRLFSVLESAWTERHPDIPIAKPWGEPLNAGLRGADGKPLPYLRFTVRGGSGLPIEIGSPGSNAHAFPSVLMIDVFVAPEDGDPLARLYADEILEIYITARPFIIRQQHYTGVGVASNGWYQGAVTINFERHEAM